MDRVVGIVLTTLGSQSMALKTDTGRHIPISKKAWDGHLTRDLTFFVGTHPTGEITRAEIVLNFWPNSTKFGQGNVLHVTKSKIGDILHELASRNGAQMPENFEGLTRFQNGIYVPALPIDCDLSWFNRMLDKMASLGDFGAHERLPILEQIAQYIGNGTFLQDTSMRWAEAARNEVEYATAQALLELAMALHPVMARPFAAKFANLAQYHNWLRFFPNVVPNFGLEFDEAKGIWS